MQQVLREITSGSNSLDSPLPWTEAPGPLPCPEERVSAVQDRRHPLFGSGDLLKAERATITPSTARRQNEGYLYLTESLPPTIEGNSQPLVEDPRSGRVRLNGTG